MILKQMTAAIFVLVLTSLLPFFRPFYEPVKIIYRYIYPF